MKKKKSVRISVRVIAEQAGVCKSTVSYVLRNRPGPSAETRRHVLSVAEKLGYAPDARVVSLMTAVRGAAVKELLPIAWLNTHHERDVWQRQPYLSPIWNGTRERCIQLGYKLEDIWTQEPGMTAKRLAQILYHRGIEGVIIGPPLTHIRLDWTHLAGVCIGDELQAPRLHRVNSDIVFNLQTALKMLKRAGYRRIGVCLSNAIDRCSRHILSGLSFHLASLAETGMVAPLFYKDDKEAKTLPKKEIMAWVRARKPDVIICFDNRMVDWLEEENYHVPRKIGVIHLAVDDDVIDWAGIHSSRLAMGRTVAELIISLVQNRQFGVPAIALDTTVHGQWQQGRTLAVPKPGS